MGKFLIHLFGLPLLEPDMVYKCPRHYFVPNAPSDRNVKKYLQYLVKRYCSPTATFPPAMWAEMSSSVGRTTNACEAFHWHFNAQFYSPQPNIFVFLTVLSDVQTDTELLIRTASRQEKIPRKRASQKIDYVEKKISELRKIDVFSTKYAEDDFIVTIIRRT